MAKRQTPRAAAKPPTTGTNKTATKRPRNEGLTVRDINRDGVTRVKLSGVLRIWYDNVRRATSIIIEVVVGGPSGPRRDYFLTIGRPDFIAAKKQLGDDLGQWGGQVLEVQQDPTRQYVNVADDDRPDARPTGAEAAKTDDDIPF